LTPAGRLNVSSTQRVRRTCRTLREFVKFIAPYPPDAAERALAVAIPPRPIVDLLATANRGGQIPPLRVPHSARCRICRCTLRIMSPIIVEELRQVERSMMTARGCRSYVPSIRLSVGLRRLIIPSKME
jgi:hypothetical protein